MRQMVGRALRGVVNLEMLGPRTITLDCDVLQADGGTRTASMHETWGSIWAASAAVRWPWSWALSASQSR